MDRRHFLFATATLGALPLWARAHHGWSGFDVARPLYVAGTVLGVRWHNPHAELAVRAPAALRLPDDLRRRILPAQTAAVDGAELLARASVPDDAEGAWTLELSPLFRLEAWQLAPIGEGEEVEAIGYRRARGEGGRYLRVEYLFHRGRAYGLRSSPA